MKRPKVFAHTASAVDGVSFERTASACERC